LKILTCRTTTAGNICLLKSGVPFDTETMIMSPTQAAGTRLRRLWCPSTCITLSSLAPVLSAQLIRLPFGNPREIRGRYSTIPLALTARVLGAGNFLSRKALLNASATN
jgi:hypothetical protein